MKRPYRPLPTQERLQELFEYSVTTGLLYHRQGRRKGLPAGGQSGKAHQRYIHVWVDRELYRAHRVIWCLVTGDDPKELQIDHADCDSTNNTWCNLRIATSSQNRFNQKLTVANTSGFKGVSWDKRCGKWLAKITYQHMKVRVGLFDTPEEAHAAYVEAAQRLHGEFARAA
jgi:hypothetical protein